MMNGPGTEIWDDYALRIPPLVVGGLERYLMQGIPTGDFLRGVLTNDLFEAIGRADIYSMAALQDICGLIYNCFPSRDFGCWGTDEAVDEWIKRRGMEGIEAKAERARD